MVRPLCLLAATTILLGCAPKISIQPIPDRLEVWETTVRAEVDAGNHTLGDVVLGYRLDPDLAGPFTDVEVMTTPDGAQFTGTLPPLPEGQYEALVRVHYGETGTAYGLEPFVVHRALSHNCFTFDGQADPLEGWTATEYVWVGPDESASPPLPLLSSPSSWPIDPPAPTSGGSLMLPGNFGSAGPGGAGDSSGMLRIDFVSPDLEGSASWQGIQGLSVRVAGNLAVQVQPIVTVRLPDGSEPSFAPLADGEPVFFTAPANEWTIVEGLVELPEDATVIRVRVRYFIQNMGFGGGGEGILWLDGVCPIAASELLPGKTG